MLCQYFCLKQKHMTPVLNILHLLPVKYRSKYKILVYAYKTLNGTALCYLEELVVPYQPTRSLRSESDLLITVPKMPGMSYCKRCFGKAAATLWNNLPLTIRKSKTFSTFKKVKPNLFLTAYLKKILCKSVILYMHVCVYVCVRALC